MNHVWQWKRVLIRVLVVVAMLIPVALVFASMTMDDAVDDAYAEWGAADMVIDYMRDHNGTWPADWNALEPYFEQSKGRVGGWTYEQFQSRVFIDFSANSDQLRKLSQASDTVPFNVIHAASFWAAHFKPGPNEKLHAYFQQSGPPDYLNEGSPE